MIPGLRAILGAQGSILRLGASVAQDLSERPLGASVGAVVFLLLGLRGVGFRGFRACVVGEFRI